MTQKEKELLLKDLCARLPYGVKIKYNNKDCELTTSCLINIQFGNRIWWTDY